MPPPTQEQKDELYKQHMDKVHDAVRAGDPVPEFNFDAALAL